MDLKRVRLAHAAQRPRPVRTRGTNDRSGSGQYKDIASGQEQLCDRRAQVLFQPIKLVSPFGTELDTSHCLARTGDLRSSNVVAYAPGDLV